MASFLKGGFPGGSGVKNLPANPRDAGDTGTVHGIAKSQITMFLKRVVNVSLPGKVRYERKSEGGDSEPRDYTGRTFEAAGTAG